MYEKEAANAQWQTCVVAKGPVRVLVLHYRDMKDLVSKRPEVEADFRAGDPPSLSPKCGPKSVAM